MNVKSVFFIIYTVPRTAVITSMEFDFVCQGFYVCILRKKFNLFFQVLVSKMM